MSGGKLGTKNAPQFFCLDAGGTGTRGALFAANGKELARASGPGGALSLGSAQSADAIKEVWSKICAQLGLKDPRSGEIELWAGVAGINLPGRREELSLLLNDFSSTHFVGDGYGALLSATRGEPGALISVGTGVIAQRLLASNKTLSLSGWGFPAGDLGGGAWIGLQLVSALTKHVDGVTLDPLLPRALAQKTFEIVGNDPHHIQLWLSSAAPRQYGSLVPHVVEQAKGGDPFSRQLLKLAAKEIADLALALYTSTEISQDDPDIHLSGGLGAILQPYCAELAPELNWLLDPVDPVSGILLLAMGTAPNENLLPRRHTPSHN